MSMDIHQILKQLPHRYPILLVDRVLEIEKGKRIRALKNVSINEPFFTGHFPHRPVMPGVLLLEAMAQATGLLAFRSNNARSDSSSMYYLVGVDKARFKRPVERFSPAQLDRADDFSRSEVGSRLAVCDALRGRSAPCRLPGVRPFAPRNGLTPGYFLWVVRCRCEDCVGRRSKRPFPAASETPEAASPAKTMGWMHPCLIRVHPWPVTRGLRVERGMMSR